MRTGQTRLAKLTRPKLHDATPRERLFRVLDDARVTRKVIWIEGPPGAGKTTLVASYLESRNLPGVWFQVDSGDSDPATFFYYLGRADPTQGSRRRAVRQLPLLTPEFLADVPAFARRFFRELFDRLGSPGVLVLDNFQEAADSAAVHEALLAGMEELPDGVQMIVVSRAGTPPYYARLNANRALAIVGWEALKLDGRESAAVLQAAQVDADAATIESLQRQAGGWAAGLVLLAEVVRRGESLDRPGGTESLNHVFAYFAGQIFDRANQLDQLRLMQLSYPASITEALARELTGTEDAVRLLDQLFRRHLFTDRRRGGEMSYQFHALFRAFLQYRAAQQLDASEQQAIARRCAELLQSAGQPDAAMPLYLRAGDLAGAERMVPREAPALIAQGRWKVVVEWVDALPQDRVRRDPWILHWLGTAYIGVDPPKAREVLQMSYQAALECADLRCQVLCAAGMVEALFLEYADFMPIDPWIKVLEAILSEGFEYHSLDEELRAHSALLVATTYRLPDHAGIDRSAARVDTLVRTGLDINLRVSAATHLTLYGSFTGHLRIAREAARILVPLLDDTTITTVRKAFAWAVLAWYAANVSDHTLGPRCIREMERIASEEEIHIAGRFACIIGYFVDMDRGDLASGLSRIERFDRTFLRDQPYEAASIVNMKSWVGMFTGDPARTTPHAPEACALYRAAGSIPHILVGLGPMVWCAVESGDASQIDAWYAEHRRWSDRRNMEWSRYVLDAGDAIIGLRTGDEERTRQALGRLFGARRDLLDQYGHTLSWIRNWASRLAAAALERDIGVEHVREFIECFRLVPPEYATQAWPWPVKVHALGRLRIEVRGNALAFTGKIPRKPLAVLKQLVCGDPAGVRATVIMDALWDEVDGDTARDAFRVALHRLRKLLGSADSVRWEGDHVSLNPGGCWVDVFALRAHLKSDVSDIDLVARARRVLDHYPAPLLGGDDQEPHIRPARVEIAARFVEHVGELLRRIAAGDPARAWPLCRRAFDTVPDSVPMTELAMRMSLDAGAPQTCLAIYQQFASTRHERSGASIPPALAPLFEAALAATAAPGKG